MSGTAEFDIDPVVPHVDLVLFDNVLSCYPHNKAITVNYTLGQAVRPTTWDWVGVFRTDWRYLGEYLAYSWVPNATDVTNHRRRGIVFPAKSHKILPNDDDQYSFLYIAQGNHVVGVSSPFKVTDEERDVDFGLDHLFYIQEASSSPDSGLSSFHELTCSGFYDAYEIIDEAMKPESGAIPKRKATCKRKITKVYRDSTTLVNLCPTWPEKLRILDVHPVVQEYMDNRLRAIVNCSQNQVVPVYDVHWRNNKISAQKTDTKPYGCHLLRASSLPSIEYPDIRSITAGPESFLVGLRGNTRTCPNCSIARTIMKDLIEKDDYKSKRIAELEEELKTFKAREPSRIDKEATVGILDWCLEQINNDNKALRIRIRDLEMLLVNERLKSLRDSHPPKNKTVDTGCLTKTVDTEAKETQSVMSTPDQDGWTYKGPRRIERLQRAVNRHNQNIQLLNQNLEAKKYQISSLQEENLQLRRLLRCEKEQTQLFCKLADELNSRIKSVLAERTKDKTNEWKRFIREAQDKWPFPCPSPTPSRTPGTTQGPTSDSESQSTERLPFNMQPRHVKAKPNTETKIVRSEKQARAKPKREKLVAEQCLICGLRFSLKADKKVIREHMDFHLRQRSRQ